VSQRKIKLLDGAFQATTIAIKDDVVLTKVKFTSKFDQLVADALDIKASLYDSDGHLRSGLRKWELEILLFGARILVIPTQGSLFDEKAAPLGLESIQLSDGAVRRLRADEPLRLSFTVTIAGIPRELLDYIEGVRKNTINITIEPASKERETTARSAAITHGLFAEPKDGDGEDEDEDEADEQDENEAEAEAEPGPDEPQELRGAALASWREVNGGKSRRRGKANVQ